MRKKYKISKYNLMFYVECRTSSIWIDLNKIKRCSTPKSCLQNMNGSKPIKRCGTIQKERNREKQEKKYMRNQSDSEYHSFRHSIWDIPFEIFVYSSVWYENKSTLQFWPFALKTDFFFHSPMLVDCTRCD